MVHRLCAILICLMLASSAYGARGFGSTDGAGTTDLITTNLTAHNATRTYAMWVWRTGDGGGGFGRMFDKGTPELLNHTSGGEYFYERIWSGGTAQWSIAAPASGQWVHLAVTYDSGAAANDPTFYINGAVQSLTTNTNSSGSTTDNANAYVIGNRADGTRNWNGRIAEPGVWNRILTAAEISALAKGFSPACFQQSLAEYVPLVRNTGSVKLGANSVTGTAVQAHPRVLQC